MEYKPIALVSYVYLIQFVFEHNENLLSTSSSGSVSIALSIRSKKKNKEGDVGVSNNRVQMRDNVLLFAHQIDLSTARLSFPHEEQTMIHAFVLVDVAGSVQIVSDANACAIHFVGDPRIVVVPPNHVVDLFVRVVVQIGGGVDAVLSDFKI